MNQTEGELAQESSEEHDYDNNPVIQSPPTFFNKFLFFNRLRMLYQYVCDIKKQKLYRYNDNFKPMISSNRILDKFLRSKEQGSRFDITREIWHMEKRTLVTLVLLSVLAGATSLVPIYFQSVLVKAVMGNTGNYYSMAVIIVVMFLRFNLLNYVLSLSSNIAINVKLYLQNTFMRFIFYIEEDKFPQLKNRLKYLDVDIIGQALFYLPYLITSQMIVIGVIVFVFLNVGKWGCVVLAVYIFFFIGIAICGVFAYQAMRRNSRRMAEREKFQKQSLSSLMKTAFERMSQYVYQLLIVQKTLQIRQNLRINVLYILGQTFGECCVVVSNIILYSLSHSGQLIKSDVYYSVLFMVTTFYPIRYSVYGFFTMLKAYEAFRQIRLELKTISSRTIQDLKSYPPQEHESHVFVENVGDCFEYSYSQMAEKTEAQSEEESSVGDQFDGLHMKTLKSIHEINVLVEKGETLMVLSRVDSKPSCSDYFQQLIAEKPPRSSLAMINQAQFMLPESVKENILFYSPYLAPQFAKVLKITQLDSLYHEIIQSRHSHDNYLRFSEWHQSRIELARALYNNVDYLLINRPSLLEDVELLKNVIQQRKAQKKITVIANNTHKYFFKLVDKILVIGKEDIELGKYDELRNDRGSLFNKLLLKYHVKVDHSLREPETTKDHFEGVLQIARPQEKPIELEKTSFFEFFSFVHRKAEFVVILSLFAPPCFKYYLQNLIGQSVTIDIFTLYLIIGLIYLLFIFLRGFCLSMYTNMASLSLYRKICRKYKRLNAHQILSIYQKPSVDFAYHSRIIDRNLVMDFEYGQSILIEIVISFIVYCTGQPLYIAVAIPIIVFIVYINGYYAKHARKMYLLRLKETKGIHKMVANAVQRNRAISKYQKINDFNRIFHAQNRIELIYGCNIEWLQTGVRTIAEFLVLVFFIIFLVIMIETVQNDVFYTSLVSLGCSMFINLMYLNTFYLKAFRQLEISLVSLTLCLDVLKNEPNLTEKQKVRSQESVEKQLVENVEEIRFDGVSLRYFKNVCDKLDLTLKKGERVVLSGNANSFKQTIFYMLENNIFDSDEIKGDIYINGQLRKEFVLDKLFYLHSEPMLPFLGNIFEALKLDDRTLTHLSLEGMLAEFFRVMDIDPIFSGLTLVEDLSVGQKQLLEVFRAVNIEKCKILVIINGLDSLDIVSRRKLTKYLIQESHVNLLLEATNTTEIINLYPRHLVFRNQKIQVQETNPQQRKLRREESIVDHLERAMTISAVPSQQVDLHTFQSKKE